MNVEKKLKELDDYSTDNIETIDKRKKFMIVGMPERIITNNKISYKIPVRLYNDDNSIKEKTTQITVSEEDMMTMLKMAKEMFADEDTNRSYV